MMINDVWLGELNILCLIWAFSGLRLTEVNRLDTTRLNDIAWLTLATYKHSSLFTDLSINYINRLFMFRWGNSICAIVWTLYKPLLRALHWWYLHLLPSGEKLNWRAACFEESPHQKVSRICSNVILLGLGDQNEVLPLNHDRKTDKIPPKTLLQRL